VLLPTVAVVVLIFTHGGSLGVLESMKSISATWVALYGLVRCGRWWRDVKPPGSSPRFRN
jgi:hypothetical protein